MTTPNTTLSPTQRVEQMTWTNGLFIIAEITGAYSNEIANAKREVLQLATELEAAQKELDDAKFAEETYQFNLAESMKVQSHLRQQLAAKTRECERLQGWLNQANLVHQELSKVTVITGTPSQMPRFVGDVMNQLRTENAEPKKDKERLDWLEKADFNMHSLFVFREGTLRTAIDAAMQPKEGK